MVVVFVFCLLYHVLSHPSYDDSIGGSFVDSFEEHNPTLWLEDDRMLVCVEGPTQSQCIYYVRENLAYIQNQGHPMLRISMNAGCDGENCCDTDGCATHTAGQIKSQYKYGFGSFRFIARVAAKSSQTDELAMRDALTCFMLESPDEDEHAVYSLCISSGDTTTAVILMQQGDKVDVQSIKLKFDASKTRAVYRIDWFPGSIKWYANGVKLTVTKSSHWTIPESPLIVRISILPYSLGASKNVIQTESNLEDMAHAYIYRMRYIKSEDMDKHNELFVISDSSFTWKSMIIFSLGFLCFLLVGYLWKPSGRNNWKSLPSSKGYALLG